MRKFRDTREGLSGGCGATDRPQLLIREQCSSVRTEDGHQVALTELCFGEGAPATEGPSFLLLHGLAQNRLAYTLGDLPRALVERGARVFAGELRGHGNSRVAGRRRDWSLRTHLEQDVPALLGEVRRQTGRPEVHVIGHSMGGMLGYALLARPEGIASLTTFGAPLEPHQGRPLTRAAAALSGPLVKALRPSTFPMHLLLGTLAPILAAPDPGPVGRLLQRVTKLANPRQADPDAVLRILASAHPESSKVFVGLATMKWRGPAVIGGVNIAEAVRASSLPVAAVVGTSDLLATRATVEMLEQPGHGGPRRVVEIPGAAHVDLTMGHHVRDTLAELWDFLLAS